MNERTCPQGIVPEKPHLCGKFKVEVSHNRPVLRELGWLAETPFHVRLWAPEFGGFTASVNGSGVQFSNNGGQSSSSGVYVNGTPNNTFQDAGFANGGALSGFQFTLTNSKMEANQAEAETFSFGGTPEQAGAALQRAGFAYRSVGHKHWVQRV
jgi:hypothetical protein